MSFTHQMNQAPKSGRFIASENDKIEKEEVKPLTHKEEKEKIEKELKEIASQQLICSDETPANDEDKAQNEKTKADLEEKRLALVKRLSELDKLIAEDKDKELEDLKKEIALLKEEKKEETEEDSVTCLADNQPATITSLFSQLVQQQQLITTMFMQVQNMMFTQMLQNQYLQLATPKYTNVGQNGYSLDLVLGVTQNILAPAQTQPVQAANNPVQAVDDLVPSQIIPQVDIGRNFQGTNLDLFVPSQTVVDVSRNPMYVPQFGSFTDGNGANQFQAVPYKF